MRPCSNHNHNMNLYSAAYRAVRWRWTK